LADFVHGRATVNVRLSCALTLVALAGAGAQTASDGGPFSRATLRAGALRQTVDSRLAQLYKPSTGWAAEVSAPADIGELAVGIERATFQSISATRHPDFHGTVGMLKWRVPLPPVGPFAAAVGAHAGLMQFSFQDTVIAQGLRKEREVLFGVNALGSVRFTSHLSAFVAAEYTHVWLHVPVHLTPISAGVGYTVALPGWMREFLQ
jgi:hypothetical protein